MAHDDPFAAADPFASVVLPSPGGRGVDVPPVAAAVAQPPSDDDAEIETRGINPLIAAANPLLNVVTELRRSQKVDIDELRERLAGGIRQFQSRALAARVEPKKVTAASYTLCALFDEAASNTTWGAGGAWAQQTLMAMFPVHANAGEIFYELLGRLAADPEPNLDLLELMYVCLALGFIGEYRVRTGGVQHLNEVRRKLADLIRSKRGAYERDLSAHWKPAAVKRPKLIESMPLWIAGAFAIGLLAVVYLVLASVLSQRSDAIAHEIKSIKVAIAPRPKKVEPARPSPITEFLKPEIAAGLVTVTNEGVRTVIRITAPDLFAPGKADLAEASQRLVARIGDALKPHPGQVLVLGHTDSQPVSSRRFRTNLELSRARAQSVMDILSRPLEVARLSAEGRGAEDPIASNDSEADRSRNRRVEVVLLAALPHTN